MQVSPLPGEGVSDPGLELARSRIDAQLQRSLVHLRTNGTSTAAVDAFETFLREPGTLRRPALVVRCRFIDGAFEHSIVVDNPKMRWRLAKNFLPFVQRIDHRIRVNADVLVLLSDTIYVAEAHAQRFAEFMKRVPFLRPDWRDEDPISSHAIAIPDFTLQEVTWEAELAEIVNVASRIPFAERKAIIKWRGRLTGPDYPDADNCHQFPRYHLLKLAAQAPSYIDARITHYDNFPDTESARALRRELDELLGGAVPEVPACDFAYHQSLLSTDGVVATWKRVANSLWTGSTLLLQHRWKQFFYPGLVAWEHYVPVAHDLSDLLDQCAWLRANPERAEQIGRQGRLFAERFLTASAIEDHFVTVIDECAALPRIDQNLASMGPA